MTERSATHATFTIERSYPVPPARVFAAFADGDAKGIWMDDPDFKSDGETEYEMDFRVGGHERFGNTYQGVTYTYDALYYDIVPDERLVYSYEMYADGVRLSVSVATIEFAKTDDVTTLTWTEQGAYLDGIDGEDAARLREGGTSEMLDGLTKYLA